MVVTLSCRAVRPWHVSTRRALRSAQRGSRIEVIRQLLPYMDIESEGFEVCPKGGREVEWIA